MDHPSAVPASEPAARPVAGPPVTAPPEAGSPPAAAPGPASREEIARLRGRIDRLDAELADLLERRALVAAQVQRLKPVGYFAGRDAGRERALVERMARHAPRLGPDRLAAIMDSVITAGLAAAEEEAGGSGRADAPV